MATRTLSLPLSGRQHFEPSGLGSESETESISGFAKAAMNSGLNSSSSIKHPHTRAQLLAIARQFKPQDSASDVEEDFAETHRVLREDDVRVPNALVSRVVSLLDADEFDEDELKKVLKSAFSISPSDNDIVEQSVLDLMHKHRDDTTGVPFLYLTPTRRPISRPSSRASNTSSRLRPDSPSNSAPSSPKTSVFRRPHTPVTSPLAGMPQPSSYITASSTNSPHSSPKLAHAQYAQSQYLISTSSQYTASLPSSPLSSPRLLNAKANEFRPIVSIPRPLSAASSIPTVRRAESPDLWAHAVTPSPVRATSNLAIAAPLTPLRTYTEVDDTEEYDPFDPFAAHSWSSSSNDNAALSQSPEVDTGPFNYDDLDIDAQIEAQIDAQLDAEADALLTEDMAPFDVLSSVFGSTLAPSELEEALANNGYDFERAMGWLVDRLLPNVASSSVPIPSGVATNMGGRVTIVPRDPRSGGFQNQRGGPPPRYVNGRPVQNANRVCRYFVAGECLRADCRFSHDLERALCRFWLRGTCAKQETCEFLHHLPKDVDINSLNAAMARANLAPIQAPIQAPAAPPPDEFPALGFDASKRGGYTHHDPGRTRFAAAVKRQQSAANTASREAAMGFSADDNLHHRSAIVAPRPSPRTNLRPPSLLPTLPTGPALSALYTAYRSRALQLGAARNACLSRAADAWRRGDGAAAKRFSREGHDLNARMSAEMRTAAASLVRERTKIAEVTIRGRDTSWSDDPGDRATRGRVCGGGLGVILGIASKSTPGKGKPLTPEERTECVLDLHGLHAGEAVEVLEEFLMTLEREHFYGLAYLIVGEEKHTGTADVARGASRMRLATAVREFLHRWGYPWSERDGILCVDPLTHATE